jgi:hypothetical protein
MNTAKQSWKPPRLSGRVCYDASNGMWINARTRGFPVYAPGLRADFGTIVEFDYCFDDRGRPVALNVVTTLQPTFSSTRAKE